MSSAPTAPAANAVAAPSAGGSPAAPSSNPRRNYYHRPTSATTANANDTVHNNANWIIKNDVFDIGATAMHDQFRRTLQAIESYVQTNYTNAGDVVLAIRTLAPPPALTPPTRPVRDANNPSKYQFDVIHYDVEYKANAVTDGSTNPISSTHGAHLQAMHYGPQIQT